MRFICSALIWLASTCCAAAHAQLTQSVVDIPTRDGVTQRLLVLSPSSPKASVVLLAGGHGGLQIFPNGSMKWGENSFLVRTRQMFADQGLAAIVVDAPSDRQSPPFLQGTRQSATHLADIQAVVAWARSKNEVPVWLVGTSRGTQSAAYVATQLQPPAAPDGIVLTSSILRDDKSRALPEMPLGRLKMPVLVVHHEQDGCRLCAYSEMPALMDKLAKTPKHQLLSFSGGRDVGDPCEAMSHHGFNGIESQVVQAIGAWIQAQ